MIFVELKTNGQHMIPKTSSMGESALCFYLLASNQLYNQSVWKLM